MTPRRQGACPTGKVRYPDKLEAMIALTAVGRKKHTRRKRHEQRCYRCPECGGGWHLTSR